MEGSDGVDVGGAVKISERRRSESWRAAVGLSECVKAESEAFAFRMWSCVVVAELRAVRWSRAVFARLVSSAILVEAGDITGLIM